MHEGTPSSPSPTTELSAQGSSVARSHVTITDAAGASERAVVIHAGDVLCMAQNGGGKWTPVNCVAGSAPHLKFEMKVDGKMTILSVHNASPKQITYHVVMKLKDRARWAKTNVWPLFPGITGFESWMDPIEALAIFGISSEDSQMELRLPDSATTPPQ